MNKSERDELRRLCQNPSPEGIDGRAVALLCIELLNALDEVERKLAEAKQAIQRLEGQLYDANERRRKDCAALQNVIEAKP